MMMNIYKLRCTIVHKVAIPTFTWNMKVMLNAEKNIIYYYFNLKWIILQNLHFYLQSFNWSQSISTLWFYHIY